jgi:hypothetical protein
MTDDLVTAIAGRIERDLWDFVANVPPDPMDMKNLCAWAAQLRLSQIITERDGCSPEQAREFVVVADSLSVGLEHLGARAGGSCLAEASQDAQNFATVLLDLLVAARA